MTEKRKSYSPEFKVEAVALVTEQGMSVSQVAKDLGVHPSAVWRWKKKLEEGSAQEVFPGKGNLSPQEAELARLRRENQMLREERDILKKAVGIFSRVPK